MEDITKNTSVNSYEADLSTSNKMTCPGPTLEPSAKDSPANYLAYHIGVAIHIYYLPVIIVLGTFGNTLSLIIMLQRKNRRLSLCV